MTQRFWKTLAAFVIAFILTIVFNIVNERPLDIAFQSAIFFGLLVAAIEAVVEWGADTTEEKGYGSALGFLLVLFLNVVGMLIVWLLPWRKKEPVSIP